MTIRKSVSQQQQQQQQQQVASMGHQQQGLHQSLAQPQIPSNTVLPGPLAMAPTSSLPMPNVNPYAHAHAHTHTHGQHQPQPQAQAPQGAMFPPAYNYDRSNTSMPLHSHQHHSPSASINPPTAGLSQMGLFHNPLMQPPSGATNFGGPLMQSGFPAHPGGAMMPQTEPPQAKMEHPSKDDQGTVRVDEVERALKSKPQRGKKRENLTISEKKELTKTRNRMHATKTRIRKKARHDELVECEKEYHKLLKERECEVSRKKSILEFMALRTKIFNMKSTNDDIDTCSWKKTFGHDNKTASRPLDLPDIFVPNPVFYVGSNAMDLRGMYEFEHHFADELSDTFRENDDETKLEYVIPGSIDGIALSNISTAYAEYKLISGASDETNRSTVSGGLIQVQFERDSNKIASVKMHIVPPSLSQSVVAPNISMNDGASACLGEREFFPSVVSLDQQQPDKKMPGRDSSDQQPI